MNESVNNFIKDCAVCAKNDQKPQGGATYIATTSPLSIMAADLMFIDQNKVLLTCIDYYTRLARAILMPNKESRNIQHGLEKIFNEIGTPKTFVTDNGKEFDDSSFKKMLVEKDIIHHKTSPEKHQSNGRIERLHRTLWQAIRKKNDESKITDWESAIASIISEYNNTIHRGIKMTPNTAWADPKNSMLLEINSLHNEYSTEFNTTRRETFDISEKVFIENSEITKKSKISNKYEKIGEIAEKLDGDSYLVKYNDKIVKRNHSQLKKVPQVS